VVATMTFLNKVSLAFPYLDDIRYGADDGQVRASSARSEGSLQIFAVGVSIRRCSWLSFVVVTSTSFFDFFMPQYLVSSTLYFRGEGLQACIAWGVPQPMFFQQFIDLVVSNEWFLRSSHPCVTMAFAGVLFPLLPFQCVFKFQWTTNNQLKKMTRELFRVILFSLYCLVLSCPSIVLPIVFLYMN